MLNFQHSHGEAGKLPHGKVLPESAPENRPEELLKRLTDGVYIRSGIAQFLKDADDLGDFCIRQVDTGIRKKDRRVSLARFREQFMDAIGNGGNRFLGSNLNRLGSPSGVVRSSMTLANSNLLHSSNDLRGSRLPP